MSAGGLVYSASIQGAVMPATGGELWELAPPISCRLLEVRIAINEQPNLASIPTRQFFALTIASLTAPGSGGSVSIAPLDARSVPALTSVYSVLLSAPGTPGAVLTAVNIDNGSTREFAWPGDGISDSQAILIAPATRVGIFLVPIYANASFTLSSVLTFEEF